MAVTGTGGGSVVGDGDEGAVLRADKRDPVWGPWNNTYLSGATC